MRGKWICASAGLAVVAFLAAVYFHRLPLHPSSTAQPPPAETVEALIANARACVEKNDIDGAIRHLDAVIAKEPANQDARRMRGDLYYKKNDLDRAMADYAELRTEMVGQWTQTEKKPVLRDREATEQMRMAQVDEDSGRIDDAFARYTVVLTWDVSSATASTACQNRGNLFNRRGEIDKALRDYEQAIRLNPRNAGAYTNRGVVLAQKGDHDDAIKDFNAALQLEPTLFKAIYNRGLSYRDLGDPENAERDFDATIKLSPNFALVHVNRAALYAQQKKFAQAAADYKAAQKLDPSMPEPFIGLAFLNLHEGKQAEAVSNLEKALKLRPDYPQTLNALGWLRATSPVKSLRDGRKAIDLAMQACQLSDWAEFQFVDTLAAAYAETGEFEKAVEFQRFALNLPSLPETQRGDAEKRLKQYSNHQPYRDATRP